MPRDQFVAHAFAMPWGKLLGGSESLASRENHDMLMFPFLENSAEWEGSGSGSRGTFLGSVWALPAAGCWFNPLFV